MGTKEINQENIKTLVKLGIDTKDIADIYLAITEKGADISKDTYINNLTEKLKFFQTRNNHIENEKNAILKEDVLNMIKNNKDLIGMDIDKKIKPICNKLDSYYFMNCEYTNNVIKNNSKIFNIKNENLENYSKMLSEFAIEVDGGIINLLEYVIKQQSEFLENDFGVISTKIMEMEEKKNSKLFTIEEMRQLGGK